MCDHRSSKTDLESVVNELTDALHESHHVALATLWEAYREMEARAVAAVWLIPPETICGDLQALRDKAKRLLAHETPDDHEADLANQLQEVDRAFRVCLKELDTLRARVPTSDYILLSDTGEVHHKDYGMVLFATHDAVHSVEGIARSPEEPFGKFSEGADEA